MDLTQGGQKRIGQILELVGASFTVDVNGQQTTFTSPFVDLPVAMAIYMPSLMDKLTTVSSPILPGRININEAPRQILKGIPGLSEEVIDAIIQARAEESESENRKFETWPLVEGLVSLEQMRMIGPLITGGGDVFRAQIVGYFEDGAAFSRIEAVIDAAEEQPKTIAYRRLDQFERGFSAALLGQRSVGLLGQ
jgi:hypothetical protein